MSKRTLSGIRAQIHTWQPIAALSATGSLLLGPHERGVQAVVPPAVLARTPAGDYSDSAEWRISIWDHREADALSIEASRPSCLVAATLADVIALVAREAPDHRRGWLDRQIAQRVLCLGVLIEHADDDEHDRLAAWIGELDDLLLEATRAFGQAWVRRMVAPIAGGRAGLRPRWCPDA